MTTPLDSSPVALVRAPLGLALTVVILLVACMFALTQSIAEGATQDVDSRPSRPDREHPWADRFARVSGRILEHDGSPAAGLTVELLAYGPSTRWPDEHRPTPVNDLKVSRGETDAAGRFTLGRARVTNLHLLSIDPGGPRSTARVLEQSLEFGATTQLDDVVLAQCGVVTGTVVDENGDPIAGARVRLGPVPERLVDSGVLDANDSTRLAVASGADLEVAETGDYLMRPTSRFPLSTGFTRDDGSFKLERVPIGVVSGGVDAEGHVATVVQEFELEDEVDIGEQVLREGRRVEVTVFDAAGEPVSDVEVLVGARSAASPFAFLQHATWAEESGVYEALAVHPEGAPVAFARGLECSSWTDAFSKGTVADLTVDLPSAGSLTLRVADGDGAPLSDLAFRMRPASAASPSAALGHVAFAAGAPRPWTSLNEVEPGLYVQEATPFGTWLIEARADGAVVHETTVEHSGNRDAAIELAGDECTALSFRLLERGSESPIEGVHIVALAPAGFVYEPLSSSWTDSDGRARVKFLPASLTDSAHSDIERFRDEYLITFEHPGFGTSYLQVASKHLAARGEIVRRMGRSTSIEGRVSWGGNSPEDRYMVALQPATPDFRGVFYAQLASTDEDGVFRIGSVAEGSYELRLSNRFFHGEPIEALTGGVHFRPVTSLLVEAKATCVTKADITLSERGETLPGWFEGQVVEDGVPLPGVTVIFHGKPRYTIETDEQGRFRTEALDPDRSYAISVYRDGALAVDDMETRPIFRGVGSVPSGSAMTLNLVVELRPIVIEVKEAGTGRPIAEAFVECVGPHGLMESTTDADGILATTLRVAQGPLRLAAGAPGSRVVAINVPFDDGDDVIRAVIELPEAIDVSGNVLFDASVATGVVRVAVAGNGDARQVDITINAIRQDDGTYTFSESRLIPGMYEATFKRANGTIVEVQFFVPSSGTDALVLDFRTDD